MVYARSTKRQYQPQISNFFSPSGTSTNSSLVQSYSVAAAAPEHVQSSLLSVGMRVRKAVPEGYRNKDQSKGGIDNSKMGLNEFELQGTNQAISEDTILDVRRQQTQRTELLPFCGIHKIGGLGMQDNLNEEIPFGISSQESNFSTTSLDSEVAGANLRKRGICDEEEEEAADDRAHFDPAYFDEHLFGLLERGIPHQLTQRPIARAVTRRSGTTVMSATEVARPATNDFEDAGFLQPDDDAMFLEG